MPGMAQSTNAIVSGLVLDPSGKPIVGADVEMVNDATGIRYPGATNSEGIYQIPNLPPGPYRLQVSKPGFKTLIKPDIVLRTEDALAVNFTLPVGAASETVTVQGGRPTLETESAAVSTVIDRQFVENFPLNGRSFQYSYRPHARCGGYDQHQSGWWPVQRQRAAAQFESLDGGRGQRQHRRRAPNSPPGNGFGGGAWRFQRAGRHQQSGVGRCDAGVSDSDVDLCAGIWPSARRTNLDRHPLRD